MPDETSKLFENFFGFKDKPGAKEPAPDVGHAEAPPPEAPGTPEDAARSVRDAVLVHTGKRRAVKAWRPVAAKALGLHRLVEERWQEVLDKGIELGVLHIDTTSLSYPVLVGIPDPEPEPVDEEWEGVDEVEKAQRVEMLHSDPDPPTDPPKWDPPTFLDCGHWNYQTILKPDEDYTAIEQERAAKALKDGGYGMVKPRTTVKVGPDEDCPYCKLGKAPDSYQHQKEESRTVIPESNRRTLEKEAGPGYSGLCTDPETGFYIGGMANNCRHANPKDGPWCVVHQRQPGSKRGEKA